MSDEFRQLVDQLTPEVYENMKRAVETGRWPDGRTVTDEQRQICMQAVITWEAEHLPEDERTGYMPPKGCKSEDETEQPVSLRDGSGDDNA